MCPSIQRVLYSHLFPPGFLPRLAGLLKRVFAPLISHLLTPLVFTLGTFKYPVQWYLEYLEDMDEPFYGNYWWFLYIPLVVWNCRRMVQLGARRNLHGNRELAMGWTPAEWFWSINNCWFIARAVFALFEIWITGVPLSEDKKRRFLMGEII